MEKIWGGQYKTTIYDNYVSIDLTDDLLINGQVSRQIVDDLRSFGEASLNILINQGRNMELDFDAQLMLSSIDFARKVAFISINKPTSVIAHHFKFFATQSGCSYQIQIFDSHKKAVEWLIR